MTAKVSKLSDYAPQDGHSGGTSGRPRASLDPKNDEVRDRLRRLFLFLRERAALDEPPVRTLEGDAWKLFASDLPDHPAVRGASTGRGADGARADTVILSVKQVRARECPRPPEELHAWLKDGWTHPGNDASVFATCTNHLPGRTATESFTSSPRRVESFERWNAERARWRQEERPARAAIALYERLFALRQTMNREADQSRIVVGDAWLIWEHSTGRIHHPLVLRELQIEFDEQGPRIDLVAVKPPELHSTLLREVPEIDGAAVGAVRTQVEREEFADLDPSEACKIIANHLFARADVDADVESRPTGTIPRISAGLVFFRQSRSGATQLAAERFLEALTESDDVPEPLRRVVLEAPSEHATAGGPSHAADAARIDPLFTLPANDEQVEILRRLEQHGSVVVQGPPGTGKTHTIANLIGDFLARGLTVLVTSHTSKALRVLRDKVVPELQPLCVDYSSSDSEGRDQLERSVRSILGTTAEYRPDTLESLRRQRESIRAEQQAAERELDEARRAEIDPIVLEGRSYLPAEAARELAGRGAAFAWLPGPVTPGVALPLSHGDLLELYASSRRIDPSEEADLQEFIPPLDRLPSTETLRATITALQEAQTALGALVSASDISALPPSDEAATLIADTRKATDWLRRDRHRWVRACLEDVERPGARAEAWRELAGRVATTRDRAAEAFRVQAGHEIEVAPDVDRELARQASAELAAHVRGGGSLSWLRTMGKAHWQLVLEECRVDGRPPRSADDFQALATVLEASHDLSRLRSRWSKLTEAEGGAPIPERAKDLASFIDEVADLLVRALSWHTEEWRPLRVRFSVLPSNLRPPAPGPGPKPAWRIAEEMVLQLEGLAQAAALKEEVLRLRARLDAWDRTLSEAPQSALTRQLSAALKVANIDRYEERRRHAARLLEKRDQFERRRGLLSILSKVAPAWAQGIERRQAPHDSGALPGNVQEAWRLRQLSQALEHRAGLDADLAQQRVDQATTRLRQVTTKLVVARAWSNLQARATPDKQQALGTWMTIQAQIGKGTGKRAPKLMRQARETLGQCASAIPVWIMPLSRVLSTYHPAKTRFDVLIVDEASQCGLEGLFAFGLANRVVVVGDNEQVSPMAVGENVDRVDKLIDQYLYGIPAREVYNGRLSIYDLGCVSQSAIRLREHFRCVPEIIAFSNALAYDGEIQCLRDGSGTKTLPAVVEHRVAGRANGDNINPREAVEVAALVESCCQEPEYRGASMAVVTLLGNLQADLIQQHLIRRIPQEFERRRIICGTPAHLQGDERDVVFLSTVWSSAGAPLPLNDRADFKKRLNVAASRARNQLWVVHSLNPEVDLKDGDLRKRLLDHARDPSALLRALEREHQTESNFERDVLRRLVSDNFRVRPQYEVGAYRIDLVVEGDGARVAVECDGDRWHSSPEQLQHDRRRQAQLERLGWTFIRIRASRFYLDPEAEMRKVTRRLRELGVPPLGPLASAGEHQRGRELKERVLREAARVVAELQKAAEEEAPERHRAEEAGPPRPGHDGSTEATEREPRESSTRPRRAGRSAKPKATAPVAGIGARTEPKGVAFASPTETNAAVVAGARPPQPTQPLRSTAPAEVASQASAATLPTIVWPLEGRLPRVEDGGASPVRFPEPPSPPRPVSPSAPAQVGDRKLPAATASAAPSASAYRPAKHYVSRELQALDIRFHEPKCEACGAPGRLDVTKQGIVVQCSSGQCRKATPVDLPALQSLADRLALGCFRCGLPLVSERRSWGHMLWCPACLTNNSWEAVNQKLEERLKASSKST